MIYKSVLTAVLVIVMLATATGQEDQKRVKTARGELKKLEARGEKLPSPPKLNPRSVPTPPPHLIQLAQDIHRFAAANGDLDLAAQAYLMKAAVCAAMGDPARAIESATQAQLHEKSYEFHKVNALSLKAAWRSQYGDFIGSMADLELLLKDYPDHRDVSDWRKRLEDTKGLEAKQKIDRDKLSPKALGASPGALQKSRGRALRFAAAFPLAKFSEQTLVQTSQSMGKATDDQLCAVAERLAHYFPRCAAWAESALVVVRVFSREGEYEKALFHAQNLMNRSEVLKGNQATQLGQLCAGMRTRLTQIYGRPIEVEPKTKKKRLAHFFRFAKPYEDQDAVAQMAEELKTDYPTMSETPKVAWILANAIKASFPEQTQTLYREIAEKYPNSQWAYPSLENARVTMEAADGAEATEKWLGTINDKFPRDDHKAQIAMSRADLLDKLDRWEDAKNLLQPWIEKSFGGIKDNITRRIAEFDKKLGN